MFARTCPNPLSRVLIAVTLVVAVFVATLSAAVATATEAGASNTESVTLGMPFAGEWAYNINVSPPYTDQNSSHPSVHPLYGGSDWSIDIYPGSSSTPVKLKASDATGAMTFSAVTTDSPSCGKIVKVTFSVNGQAVGWVAYTHLTVTGSGPSGAVSLGDTLGTPASCSPASHVHLDVKNLQSGYACWTDHGNPGASLSEGDSLGVLGADNTGTKQACDASVGAAPLDITVFRPSIGAWHTRNGSSVTYGQSGDIPVRADWNGDGSLDAAVFRPSTGQWHIRNVGSFSYGQSGDIPVPGDYDGNGSIEAAVYRPSTGAWHVRGLFSVTYGNAGDVPVPADYNNDGTLDIAVFRPGTNEWHIRNQYSITYGQSGDIPVQADWNSDGYADVAVFRPSTGAWYIRNVGSFTYGQSGDIPMAMDYDGNGYVEAVVFRPSTNLWAVRGILDVIYGQSGDIPATIPLNRTNLQTFGLVA